MHLLRLCNQLLSELGMRDIDEVFRSLPGCAAFHHCYAVLSHNVHGVRACVCDDTAVCQRGTDAAHQVALLVRKCGGHADEGFSASGGIGSDDEIKLVLSRYNANTNQVTSYGEQAFQHYKRYSESGR